MKVVPEEGYVVAEALDTSKTKAGIYVADSQKNKKMYLEIVSTASKKYKKGQIIIPSSGLMEVEVDFKKSWIVHEDDICATIV